MTRIGELAGAALHRCTALRESSRDRHLAEIRALEAARSPGPLFSVVMPVYNPPRVWLEEAIDSVRNQTYAHWELCIADDASTSTWVQTYLADLARADARVRVTFREVNGHISRASNSALELATGDFMVLLDNDDLLSPVALTQAALHLGSHPDDIVIYSDEDKIDEKRRRFGAYRKPGWNPDLLLSQNYVSHLGVYRLAEVRELGGFREGFEGSQDHDLALRMAAVAGDRVGHVPYVLYHWRTLPSSAASGVAAKPYTIEAGTRAVQAAVGDAMRVTSRSNDVIGGYRLHAPEGAATTPSIKEQPVVGRDFAGAVSRALAQPTEDHVLFLAEGVRLSVGPEVLRDAVAQLARPGVGAVGGVVLDGAGAIVDGALWTGSKVRRHRSPPTIAWRGVKLASSNGPNGRAVLTQTATALSSSLLLVSQETLGKLGVPEAGDTCADLLWSRALTDLGLRCVWLPDLQGVATRPLPTRSRKDVQTVVARQPDLGERDPLTFPSMSRWDPRYEPRTLDDARGIDHVRRVLRAQAAEASSGSSGLATLK